MRRYFNLDCARALAILLVTGFHVWRFQDQPQSLFSSIFAYGFSGVDLFFVISGYAMMLTQRNITSAGLGSAMAFLKARALRIYPTYIVAMVFWAVMVRHGVAVKSAGAYDILAHLLMLHTFDYDTFFSISGVFWSLAVEAHFYVIFPLLVKATGKARLALVVLSLLFTLILDSFSIKNVALSPVLRWNVLSFLPLFVLGMELYGHQNAKNSEPKPGYPYPILGAILLLKILEAFFSSSIQDATSLMLSRLSIGAILGVICIRFIPREIPKNIIGASISLIGVSSYSIYLFNYIFWMLKSPIVPGNIGIIATSIGVVLFGVLMWALIEQPFEAMRHSMNMRRASTH